MPQRFTLTNEVQAHPRDQFSQIILHPFKANQLISIGTDGIISIFSLPHLHPLQKINLCQPMTSIFPTPNGFLIGLSTGHLITTTIQFTIINSIKLHHETISVILKQQNWIITGSYDGRMNILDIQLRIIKTLEVKWPIMSVIVYNQKLYLAGIKTSVFNLETIWTKDEEIVYIRRHENFVIANNKLYGISDERGLSCLSQKTNCYIPCQYILQYCGRLIIISQNCITQVMHIDHMVWSCELHEQLKQEIIKSGLVIEGALVLGTDQGRILRMEMRFKNKQQLRMIV